MNILMLTNAPVPYRMDFFEELGKQVSLTVLFEQTAAEQTHRNPEWFSIETRSFKTVYLEGFKVGAKRIQPEVLRYLKDPQYDLVMVMGYSLPTEILSIFYLKLRRIPFVLCFDGMVPKQTYSMKKAIKKQLISKASYYLSTGSFTDRYITEMGGKSGNIFRVPFTTLHADEIPQSIPDPETKAQYREKLGLTGNRVVLSVGQFIHRKGFDVLIEAAAGLKEFDFYIVGDEPTEEYINLKQKFAAENVHFIGFRKKEELADYYIAADYFLLPTREDIWALVIPEAMAYGLPTITTDHCGAGVELIGPHFPECIIPTDDHEAIIKALTAIDSDPAYKEKISNENHERMKDCSIDSMVETYIQIFQTIIERKK